jgi:glyoxylase-like metal-dependent hydrolase (beta-lactamase superfamily II)
MMVVGGLTGMWGVFAVTTPAVVAAPTNRIFLLYEGYVRPIEGRELVPGVSDDGGRLVASTMGLIEGVSSTVFVDPGFIADRGLILDALERVRVSPEDVTHVFISHHHPDHTINAALFPNATVVDFWATYTGDLWEDHGDGYLIDRGIEVLRTPGHTDEDASLVVDTPLGKVVFTHVWWNETLFPPVDPIGDDQEALEASRELVLSIADCIVPGHGSKFVNPERPDATCSMVRQAPPRGGLGHGPRTGRQPGDY